MHPPSQPVASATVHSPAQDEEEEALAAEVDAQFQELFTALQAERDRLAGLQVGRGRPCAAPCCARCAVLCCACRFRCTATGCAAPRCAVCSARGAAHGLVCGMREQPGRVVGPPPTSPPSRPPSSPHCLPPLLPPPPWSPLQRQADEAKAQLAEAEGRHQAATRQLDEERQRAARLQARGAWLPGQRARRALAKVVWWLHSAAR